LSKTWQDEDDCDRRECEDDYLGQHFKLYWHPDPHDGVEARRRYNMFTDAPMPSSGVFLGKVNLGSAPKEGLTRKRLEVEHGRSNAETAYIEYEVLHSSQEVRVIEQEGEDDESEEEIQFSGQARFKRLKIDFGTLLSVMAGHHLHKLKREHATIMKTRPLRPTEVEMMAEVQKAALG
jgi:hypothetical protein